jgi:hypothetical protein
MVRKGILRHLKDEIIAKRVLWAKNEGVGLGQEAEIF